MSAPSSLSPSLVKYDTATLASNLKDSKTKSKGAEGKGIATQEILNHILPPRLIECVFCFYLFTESLKKVARHGFRKLVQLQPLDRMWKH
jgi:hypothetical protein